MTYTLTSGGVIRDADSAVIPSDPLNADWQIYQAWVASGHTPTPAAPLPPAPPPPMNYVQFMINAGLVTAAKATQVLGGSTPI